MTTYHLKPLPVNVFIWTGQDPATWPMWIRPVIMGAMIAPGTSAPNLVIKDGKTAWIMLQGEALIQYPDGTITSLSAEQVSTLLEADLEPAPGPSPSPAPTPAPAPAPSPSPAVTPAPVPSGALPPQPYEPIDHRTIDGVEYVRFYASVPAGQPKDLSMHMIPLAQWQALKPNVTTGLH